jgi:poly(3-hydroxybutyrate) depolymerase
MTLCAQAKSFGGEMSSDLLCQVTLIFGSVAVGIVANVETSQNSNDRIGY